MTTPWLLHFYNRVLDGDVDRRLSVDQFEMVVADVASMGPKGGIIVDQKMSPSQLGMLEFERTSNRTWTIRTSNISRFRFDRLQSMISPAFLQIDHSGIALNANDRLTDSNFSRSPDGSWKVTAHAIQQPLAPADAYRLIEVLYSIPFGNGMALSLGL